VDYENYQILIIDDGSTDNSIWKIQSLYPDIQILQGDGDLLWTKSVNIGIDQAVKNNADYIITLNNDLIADKNFINALIECAKNNPDAIIGSKVYYVYPEICHGGGKKNLLFPPNFNIKPFGNFDNPEYQQTREVDIVAGVGMLIPVKIIESLGMLNEKDYPHYYSDTEYMLRAKKAGYKVIFCPESKIFDNPQTTWKFPDKYYPNIINDLLFNKRSGYFVKANFSLYKNYWPKAIWFIPFYLLYIKCFAGVLKLYFARTGCL
jgi:GT2 family glycosyltransferase